MSVLCGAVLTRFRMPGHCARMLGSQSRSGCFATPGGRVTMLAKLHDVLEAVMGWTDAHLHAFELLDMA